MEGRFRRWLLSGKSVPEGGHTSPIDLRDPLVEIERCFREIAGIEVELRSGHPDLQGLCLGLRDWVAELRLILTQMEDGGLVGKNGRFVSLSTQSEIADGTGKKSQNRLG